ncbi:MAG: alpha-galactosidase [Pirellulaceae bacterium]|nr:alpha-galactosidase [Pirellulaceae bacterium]
MFTHQSSRRVVPVLLLAWGYLNAPAAGGDPVSATPQEMQTTRTWCCQHLTGDPDGPPAQPAFSFVYDGRDSAECLPTWSYQHESQELGKARTRHVQTWTDPRTRLTVRCDAVEYLDFPVVEWVVYVRNAGTDDSPIVAQLQALDSSWSRAAEGEYVLHHGTGSPADGSDYGPLETRLGPNDVRRISAAGGRPTNTDLSYFNLQAGGSGTILAVGWPGQWVAEFTRDGAEGIRVTAGQELTHFKLAPGEEVRSPLVALLFWEGDRLRSQNLWRRWMMAHSMPRPGGQLPPPQLLGCSSRAYAEMIGANEANQIMHIDRYLEEQLQIDYWWMDAGWYVQQQGWPQVGTWEVDPRRFPRGLRPISDHAHAHNVKILVWFEPERVAPGTWLYDQHPEWLLGGTPDRDHPLAGMRSWSSSELGTGEPCINVNPTDQVRQMANIRWEPGRLAGHPGPRGEYAVVRWTAPQAGQYELTAKFLAIDTQATTDVHVLHNGKELFGQRLQLDGSPGTAEYAHGLAAAAGDTVDCVVGWGNGSYVCDSTGLEIRVTSANGVTHDAAREFRGDASAPGPWSYGFLPPGPTPDAHAFRPLDRLGRPGADGPRLLNLGHDAARQWLTDHVDRLLTEQGIDLYRQDFNIDPLPFWRGNDASDRQGITEIRHVQGLLAYWDELRRRHPGMLIDTCASGGRRNDLETLRRAVPLWRSDYAFEPVGHQCMTYGASLWIPYHGTGTVACSNAPYYGSGVTPVEPYAFWSNVAPSLVCGFDIRIAELDYDALRKLVAGWRQINRFYAADYYPLTPYSRANNVWMAWQFHDPEAQAGMVQAFRRGECDEDSAQLPLQGLLPDTRYVFTELESGTTRVLNGRQVGQAGLPVTLAQRPAAAVFTYQAQP